MKRAGFLTSFLGLLLVPSLAAAQGTVTFGGDASTQTSPSGQASATPEREMLAEGIPTQAASEEEKEWAERDRKMNEASTLTGGVGLLHNQHAQGGAAGQFRVAFTTEYFSAGFLCSSEFPCRDPRNPNNQLRSDSTDHIGGRLTLSMQVLKWLEPYLSTSAFANSNPANRPQLLQVLGDSTLGAKAHAPIGKIFHVGGALELWLINGTGSVGLDGSGTSARFRGLATMDLRGLDKPVPLRFSLNATYVLDNTGEVVADTERARGTSITRIERFGLNINRVDHFDIGIGGEVFVAQEKVRPFVEYTVAVPVNRQDYRCRPNNPSNDKCLANEAVAPSSLTIGGRFFPWKRGFNLTAAFDIGVTGTGTFIEEVRPTPPWMLYLGAGWAFDTQDRPQAVQRAVAPPIARIAGRKIKGFVHEEGKADAVANAIVAWENHPELTSLATGTDGRFTTHELPEGQYNFSIRAEGYKPGTCAASTAGAGAGAGAGAPPGWTSQPPGPPPSGPAVSGGEIQVDCPLQALPKVGNILGKVKDKDTGAPVANATIKVRDSAKKDLSGSADSQGSFRFELVGPGEAQVTVDADGYLALTEKVDIKPRQDNPVDLTLTKKPKNPLVTVGKQEIVIKQQIQFAVDSAQILPESSGLLTEIADVLIKNARIKRVEVQGHTDNTGTADHNLKLSEDRSAAVVTWLTSHGVAAERLTTKGFGDTKPLAPNVTAANKQRNRRVQFIIQDQDSAPAVGPGSTPATPGSPGTPPKTAPPKP